MFGRRVCWVLTLLLSPRLMVMLHPWVSGFLAFAQLCTVLVQLEGWFRSWVPDSFFSAGGGRSSVEAWCNTELDIEEVLSGVVDSDIHLFVADVIKSF